MKKLYIIEVDESDIVECWNERAVKEIGYQEYALKQCPKIKVRPYNYSGDCISREALKAEVRKHAEYYADRTKDDRYNVGYTECACEILDFIDNAPTIPLPILNEQTAWEQGYEIGLAQGKQDRPKGEWQRHSDDYTVFYTCSRCNGYGYIRDKFCKHCGADMRGGAE